MRKISRDACQAFIDGRNKVVGNTESKEGHLYLHGNEIAGHLLGDPTVILVSVQDGPQ